MTVQIAKGVVLAILQ